MREELNLEELTGVSGGKYVINGNLNRIAFVENKKVFQLKCTPYQAMELCDSLIGLYPTEKEYNDACIAKLYELGWI